MAFERCARRDCGKPSEAVVVIVVVSLVEAAPMPPRQLALCADHAHEVVFLASYLGPH